MTLSVNHNIPALQAARSVRKTSGEQAVRQERLASGERISRASQAPSDLVLSERMRSHRGALESALRNASASSSMLQTAEASLAEINTMLVDLRGLAVQAANEGIHDENTLILIQSEATNLLESIDRVANTTRFGTRDLLAGQHSASGTIEGEGVKLINASGETRTSPAGGYEVRITQSPLQPHMQGQRPLELKDLVNSDGSLRKKFRIAIEENGRIAEFRLDNPSDAEYMARIAQQVKSGVLSLGSDAEVNQQIRSAIRGHLSERVKERGMQVSVSLEDQGGKAGGLLTVRHLEYGSAPSFTAISTAKGTLSSKTDAFSTAVLGADAQGMIDGMRAQGEGTTLEAAPQGDAQGIVLQVDPSITQARGRKNTVRLNISQNSLHFQIGDAKGNTRSISLPDVNTQNLGKTAAARHGYTSLRDLDLMHTDGGNIAMLMLDEALDDVTAIRVQLGGLQEHALENASRSMRVWREQVISAESQLRDADVAEEVSRLVSANIKLQAGTSVLTKANQSPATVLQLLGGK